VLTFWISPALSDPFGLSMLKLYVVSVLASISAVYEYEPSVAISKVPYSPSMDAVPTAGMSTVLPSNAIVVTIFA